VNIAINTAGTWYGDQVISDLRDELQKSFFESAKRIETDAKANVALGPGDPMHLRDTIRARQAVQERYKPSAYVFAGDRDRGVFWHYMVEFGTYFQPAHPFLRPAADKNFNPALAEAAHAGQRAINAKRRAGEKTRRIGMGKKR